MVLYEHYYQQFSSLPAHGRVYTIVSLADIVDFGGEPLYVIDSKLG